MKNYESLSETQKKNILNKEYVINGLSFAEIAKSYNTYANKIRRDAQKYKIKIRNKSDAQKNALESGRHSHPTKGKERSITEKHKIGMGVMKSWDGLSDKELKKRKETARKNWDKLSTEEQQNILSKANIAVRESSNKGSKLELYIFENLIKDGYRVDFHKEQILVNTKLQIDLFLPTMGVAIEIDGPSHFEPVWGDDALKRNQKYDNKKNGILLGKGLTLIRIRQTKDFSKSRAFVLYNELVSHLQILSKKTSHSEYIELGE